MAILVITIFTVLIITAKTTVRVHAAPAPKVTICHKPGTPDEAILKVPEKALRAHEAHGDYVGECHVVNSCPLDPIEFNLPPSESISIDMELPDDMNDEWWNIWAINPDPKGPTHAQSLLTGFDGNFGSNLVYPISPTFSGQTETLTLTNFTDEEAVIIVACQPPSWSYSP